MWGIKNMGLHLQLPIYPIVDFIKWLCQSYQQERKPNPRSSERNLDGGLTIDQLRGKY
jgi:hypothetical protein